MSLLGSLTPLYVARSRVGSLYYTAAGGDRGSLKIHGEASSGILKAGGEYAFASNADPVFEKLSRVLDALERNGLIGSAGDGDSPYWFIRGRGTVVSAVDTGMGLNHFLSLVPVVANDGGEAAVLIVGSQSNLVGRRDPTWEAVREESSPLAVLQIADRVKDIVKRRQVPKSLKAPASAMEQSDWLSVIAGIMADPAPIALGMQGVVEPFLVLKDDCWVVRPLYLAADITT